MYFYIFLSRWGKTDSWCNIRGDVVLKHCELHAPSCGENANYCKVEYIFLSKVTKKLLKLIIHFCKM